MMETVQVKLSERKEAEVFGNIFFFAIQAAGYFAFWLRDPAQAIWLGVCLGSALSFVETALFHRRLMMRDRLYFVAGENGVTLPPEGMKGNAHFAWEDFSDVETKHILTFTFLRFHLHDHKRRRLGLKLLPTAFIDLPVDQTGHTEEGLRAALARYQGARHLFPATEASLSTAARAA